MAVFPTVSIGIPTYNRAGKLRRCLDAVLAQDYPNIEIIVSNNASTDCTDALCRELASRHSNISYTCQAINIGLTANYDFVFEQAQGEFYLALGDDDWIAPNYISTCVAELQADPSLVGVCGVARMCAADTVLWTAQKTDLLQRDPILRMASFYSRVTANTGFYSVIRRERAAEALPTPNVLGGDWIFMARLACYGKLKTAARTYIDVDARGASADLASLCAVLGVARHSHLAYCWAVICAAAADILRRSPTYESMSLSWRLKAATAVSMALIWRFTYETCVWPLKVRLGAHYRQLSHKARSLGSSRKLALLKELLSGHQTRDHGVNTDNPR